MPERGHTRKTLATGKVPKSCSILRAFMVAWYARVLMTALSTRERPHAGHFARLILGLCELLHIQPPPLVASGGRRRRQPVDLGYRPSFFFAQV
jgi:hypothetical protein